ncbi:MAG: excinuclease ABC subunit B [Candidatus Omnitrophica bacterium]|nr:excinuclease ABC subunit B [Candidatus Omnitrophota bacterium]
MICTLCGQQEASIHLTEILNDQMMEVHLCEACAQEKGTDFKTHFHLGELLGGLTGAGAAPATAGAASAESAACESCGLSFEEFAKTGRLGCPACYKALSRVLLPLIKRVQRSSHHAGKKPAHLAVSEKAAYDLRLLQERLRKSVEMEAFEDAAKLRDEIKKFESKSAKKGKKK